MIKFRLKYKAAAMILTAAFLLAGCGKSGGDQEDTQFPPADLSVSETARMKDPKALTITRDGEFRNPLTGRWIDVKYMYQRPIAVQYENTSLANPQYGMTHADIIYEMYTEGGITRLMAIFTEYDKVEKFEPIRSDRHYYDRKAVEYDAIHVFCGASDYANENDLYQNHYPYLDFIDLISDPGLRRDDTRYAPHNAYTLPSDIDSEINRKGFSRTHRSYYQENHKFLEEFTELDGSVAEIVTIPFSNNRPWFEYYEDDRVYYRYQFGDEQVDYENRWQLFATNILIQFVHYSDLPGYENAGSQDIDWSGSGEGYYCTAGKMIPVTWKNENYTTRWYRLNGEELKMNPGKTWISVYKDTNKEGVLFEAKQAEEQEEQ
ncbi:MAG: DUF3048 domain-containing protein [Eubacterium sp.]|nr:DUF3048 domain-containing protein [Eubacterium sp.]